MVNYIWENLFKSNQHDQILTKALSNNYLFSSLNPKELHFVKKLTHIRKYKPGEKIFTQGDIGVGMYIILKGCVNITSCSSTIKTSSSGLNMNLKIDDFFGELSLAHSNNSRSATATATDHVTLIGFFRPELLEITERTPNTGVKILFKLGEVLGRRLHECHGKLSDLTLQLSTCEKSLGALKK